MPAPGISQGIDSHEDDITNLHWTEDDVFVLATYIHCQSTHLTNHPRSFESVGMAPESFDKKYSL